jgi:hypothetical protein
MPKHKTEEQTYARHIIKEASIKWGSGWNILEDRQKYTECCAILCSRLIAQQDERMHIRFFQEVCKELASSIYS